MTVRLASSNGISVPPPPLEVPDDRCTDLDPWDDDPSPLFVRGVLWGAGIMLASFVAGAAGMTWWLR